MFADKLHEGFNAEDILVDGLPLHEFSENMDESMHNLFNRNLFLVTRMFDSRAQSFIKHILMKSDKSGLKVKNFCYRIEFQARGMPHIHGVLWLERESIKKYLIDEFGFEFDPKEVPKFVDTIISCSTSTDDDVLNEIVREVQIHHHTKSCRKGKQNYCRFGYPKPPSRKTIIAVPLGEEMDKDEKQKKLQLYRDTMTKVKKALESPDLNEDQDLDSFLSMLEIDPKLYQEALSVSERGKTVVLKRSLKDRFVNNYNPMFLKAWNGNMDLQFCHDTYAGNFY